MSWARIGIAIVVPLAVGLLWGPHGFRVGLMVVATIIGGRILAWCGCGLSIRRPTIPLVWLVTYVAMIAAPGAVIAADPEHFARNPFFWSVTATLLTVPLGVLFASLALRLSATEADEFFAREPAQLQRPDLFGRMLAFGAIAAVALSVAYLLESGTPPLLAMIQQPGEYLLLRDLREDSFKLLDSPLRYFYYVLRTFGWPFVIALSLVRALQSHQAKWHLATTVIAGLGIIYASLSIAKQPVAAIFAIMFLVVLIMRGREIKTSSLVAMPIVVLSFPVTVVLMAQSGTGVNFWSAVGAILHRLFYIPAYVLYYYFEVFPHQVGYLNGLTIDKLAGILGRETFDSANYVYRYIYPERIDSGLANAAFIGNAWADFGFVGVLVSGVVLGFLMQVSQILFFRSQKTLYDLAAYAFLIFGFWLTNSTALPTVLLSNGVIFALLARYILNRLDQASLKPASAASPGSGSN
jgi:hypothetical protein